MHSINSKSFNTVIFICLAVSFAVLAPGAASRAQNTSFSEQHQQKKPSYAELSQYVQNALETEKSQIEQLKKELQWFEELGRSIKTEVSAYRIQLSTYGNLLVLPGAVIQDIEKAQSGNRSSLASVEKRIKDLEQKLQAANVLRLQTEDQQSLNEKQLAQITTETVEDTEVKALSKTLRLLGKQLAAKKSLLENLTASYSQAIKELEDVKTAMSVLTDKFEQEIKNLKKQELFMRREMPLVTAHWHEIEQEITLLKTQFQQMGTTTFWMHELRPFWDSGTYLRSLFLFILFLATILFLFRLRRFCDVLMQHPFCYQQPWRSLPLQILYRSLPLLGMTVLLSMYSYVHHLDSIPLFSTIVNVLWLLVLTKWPLDFLSLFNQTCLHQLPAQIVFRLRILIISIRIFAVAYLVLDWQIADTALILLAMRLLLEVYLVAWTFNFINHLRKSLEPSFLQQKRYFKLLHTLLFGTIYIAASGGPLLELAGYGTLALYWFMSWGYTAIVLLWAGLMYLLLDEWDQKFHEPTTEPTDDSAVVAQPIRWLIFKFCWLLWYAGLVLGILFAWGARQAVILNIILVLKHPIPIGAMTLSLMGCLHVFLIFFLTQIVARIWRHVLKDNILPKSGMDIGLQQSITTISLYLLWSFSILMALYAFGLSTATIAVAFGTLGIGLGFGLQNIFNNFFSGLILLFERPIQVGDDVEINGIWAKVQKINVRSTVVQTYDNASLIIPNADFISSQVTNWSFKDKRVRRQITVGVAYGSDVELVRQSLLEIAGMSPRVYKHPKPDVLFSDFGDSALIFKLRIWTLVDNMLKAETDIRFEIDRLFREKNITIAFPQCDVHLHQAASPSSAVSSADEASQT